MAAQVQLQPSARCFQLDGNDSVLEAALHAGLSLNYGCSNGKCGLCRARLIAGEVSKIRPHDFVFTEAEKNLGHFLLCSYTAVGDIVVEAAEDAMIPKQQISTRLKKLSPLADEILLLQLQTPRSQRLRFLAGQSVRLRLDSGFAARYPIASCPCDDRNIQFHVRLTQDDEFAQQLATLETNDVVQLTGPIGRFILDDSSQSPLLFLAFETGFAPIKSLIEHAMQLEIGNSIHLQWCAVNTSRHYMRNLVRSWADAFDNFSSTLLAPDGLETDQRSIGGSPELACASIAGACVEHAVEQHTDLSDYDIHVAGPAPFPKLTLDRLRRLGVDKRQLKSLNTP